MHHRRWIGITLVIPTLLLFGLVAAWQAILPPTVLAQAESGITSPKPGSVVSGTVPILGTAATEDFDRYELHFKPEASGDDAYAYFGGDTTPVIDGELGLWDTTNLPPGQYTLRLRVVKTDSNYEEYFVSGLVVGASAVPSPTTALTPTQAVTPTAVLTVTPAISPTLSPTATTAAPATSATPQIRVARDVNVRQGPGTNYPILGIARAGQSYAITGTNAQEDWWQIDFNGRNGWVLRSLVTAENTGTVPVVETPVPPPSPTPTPTPAVPSPTAPPAAEEEQVTSASAVPPFTSGGPITVTVVGGDSLEALNAFLRPVLAAFGPGSGSVTATVGSLPQPLPVDLTLPQTVTVAGGIVRSGEFPQTEIFLSTQGAAGEQVNALRQQFQDQGLVAPPSQTTMGPGRVFLPAESTTPTLLCSPDGDFDLSLGELAITGQPGGVYITIIPARAGSSSCTQQPAGGANGLYAILPQLAPPPDTQVRAQGGGSGGNYVEASAQLQSTLAVTDLASHYETQLAQAGWERLDASNADAVAWSAWRFTDENGTGWNATFYIVRRGGEQNSYLATLRADRQP